MSANEEKSLPQCVLEQSLFLLSSHTLFILLDKFLHFSQVLDVILGVMLWSVFFSAD